MKTKKTNLKMVDKKTKNQPETAVKVVKSDTIEACLADQNSDAEFWDLWHDLRLLIQLPDESQWGPMYFNSCPGGALFLPYHLPYVDIYNRHLNRRHRNQWSINDADRSEDDYILFVVRADRAEPTKIFCQRCGWLDPVHDPEILGSTDTKGSLAKSSNAKTEEKPLDVEREEQRWNISSKENEFRNALNKLIEAIENRSIDSAFSLERGYIQKDDDVMSALEHLLAPGISFEREFLKDGFEQGIANEVTRAQNDALSNWEWKLRKIHFNAGVLTGARLKGASIEEIRKLGERWWQM